MNKIFSWTVGSFFRTLGRIIAYLAIGFLAGYILNKINFKWTVPSLLYMNVYASYEMGDVIANTTVKMNNATISTTQKQYFGANSSINLHIESENVWNPANNNIDYQYGFISICASSEFTPKNFTPGYSSKNARIFNSYQPCQVANSNYSNAYIYYITWQINTNRVCIAGVTNTYCSLDNNYDFTVDKAMEFSLVDFGLSDKQIEVNTSNGVIINQNQTIINSMGNLTTSINNTENAVNYNGEQGRLNDDKNTDKMIDSQKVCTTETLNYTSGINRGVLNNDGSINLTCNGCGSFRTSDYIEVNQNTTITRTSMTYPQRICFYNESKTNISCVGSVTNTTYNMPNNTKYIRIVFDISEQTPEYTITNLCKNGNQALQDSMNDSNTSQASSEAGNFFNSFNTDTHGLTGIITAPLNAIQSLNNQNCSPLVLPLPYINQNLTLPCMRQIYEDNFGDFMDLYDIVTLGIISYWVMVRIFALVKDFKNPEHDEIEVVDL